MTKDLIDDYTPAPWMVKESVSECSVLEKPYYYAAIAAKGGEKMANGDEYVVSAPPTSSLDSHKRNMANARIIAAAPDMLEALRLVMKNSTNFRLKAPDYLIDKVEGALAKTEGGI